MYMIVDPQGPWQSSKWQRNWRWDDTNNWTPQLIDQIKQEFGIDPTDKEF